MFRGTYRHNIDAKGRLIIPAKYREELGDSFVITYGLDGCLFALPMETWQDIEAKLQSLPLTSSKARRISRLMQSNATECEFDRQGRILIPQNMRRLAELGRDVVLAGVGTRFEIWDPQKWEEALNFEDKDGIAEDMEGLGI